MLTQRIARKAATLLHDRRRRSVFCRPFSGRSRHRILLLTVDHRIPQSQIFPFHYHAAAFRDDLDAEIREVDLARYLAGADGLARDATVVCLQTRFEITDAEIDTVFEAIHARNPGARLVYLDWFAPTDLRLAHRVGPRVDLYLTKHLLRDRARYDAPVFGDTTLMDHYGRVHGLRHQTTQFPIPAGFWNKVILGPSFLTADFMLPVFDRGARPKGPRPIDLHARIATGGTPWYAAMRADCLTAVEGLRGVRTITGTGVGHHRFLAELRQSKICFSPFGYGEVCWRDYEAILTGAVLLKQDMAHVETAPDLFVAGETYVPVRWDLSDFAETVDWLLRDDAARSRIAGAAFDRARDYVRSGGFVRQMAPLLSEPMSHVA